MARMETKIPRKNFVFYNEAGTEVCGKFVIPQTAKKYAKKNNLTFTVTEAKQVVAELVEAELETGMTLGEVVEAVVKPVKDTSRSAKLQDHIDQCYGSEHWYRDPLTNLIATEGFIGLVEIAEANWLLTDIGAVVAHKTRDAPFQVWTLDVTGHKTAVLQCREDTNAPVLHEQAYSYTTFPEGIWKFYVENGVILLPGEH